MAKASTVTVAHMLNNVVGEEGKTLCGALLKGANADGLPICRECFDEQRKTFTTEFGVTVDNHNKDGSSTLYIASTSVDIEDAQRHAKRVNGEVVARLVHPWATVMG